MRDNHVSIGPYSSSRESFPNQCILQDRCVSSPYTQLDGICNLQLQGYLKKIKSKKPIFMDKLRGWGGIDCYCYK